jgi:hypothetical protein
VARPPAGVGVASCWLLLLLLLLLLVCWLLVGGGCFVLRASCFF